MKMREENKKQRKGSRQQPRVKEQAKGEIQAQACVVASRLPKLDDDAAPPAVAAYVAQAEEENVASRISESLICQRREYGIPKQGVTTFKHGQRVIYVTLQCYNRRE